MLFFFRLVFFGLIVGKDAEIFFFLCDKFYWFNFLDFFELCDIKDGITVILFLVFLNFFKLQVNFGSGSKFVTLGSGSQHRIILLGILEISLFVDF